MIDRKHRSRIYSTLTAVACSRSPLRWPCCSRSSAGGAGSPRHLREAVGEKFPAEAAAFIEKQGYVGSIYNHYDWGGYLIWRLPDLRVVMDGRANLHGDERILRSLKTWAGGKGLGFRPRAEGRAGGDRRDRLPAGITPPPRHQPVRARPRGPPCRGVRRSVGSKGTPIFNANSAAMRTCCVPRMPSNTNRRSSTAGQPVTA